MAARRSEATRTCLGCRTARDRSDMLRIVRGLEGEAIFDLEGRLPGRGAYVCPRPSCLRGLRSSSLSRVLKAEVRLPAYEELRDGLAVSLRRRCSDLLSIARKSGHLAIGAEAVREALARNRAELLVEATDASPRTTSSLLASGLPCPVLKPAPKSLLGSWLGRKSVAVAAVTDRGLARRLAFLFGRLTGIDTNSYHGAAKVPEEV